MSNEYAVCPEINSPETSAAGQVCYPLAHYSYISCSLFKRDTFLRHFSFDDFSSYSISLNIKLQSKEKEGGRGVKKRIQQGHLT